MSKYPPGAPIQTIDDRRNLVVPGDQEATIKWSVEHFIHCAKESIARQDRFTVALSGGSTPKAIYKALTQPENRTRIDWSKVLLFWSDERAVPPSETESNYRMAMDAGLKELPLRKDHIFRMHAEEDIETQALRYEEHIASHVPNRTFDLVMLGMGEDGHTASLFPNTSGLGAKSQRVIANYIQQMNTWRMTLTFEQINSSRHIAVYVLGKAKAHTLAMVLKGTYDPTHLPAQKIGNPQHKCLWIADLDAAHDLR